MALITNIILSEVMKFLSAFWIWLVGAAVAVVGLLWSPNIRKYTITAVALITATLGVFYWGYSSNHKVEVVTRQCSEFQKHLVTGPATDKALTIFKRNGLCK